jgi:alpha-D-xyloside xylohydrolase
MLDVLSDFEGYMKLKPIFGAALISLMLTACSESEKENTNLGSYTKNAEGIVVLPTEGEAKAVRLNVVRDDIVRVSASPSQAFNLPNSIMVVAEAESVPFEIEEGDESVSLVTDSLKAEVSLIDGKLSFYRPNGELMLAAANSGDFKAVTRDPGTVDADSYAVSQSWLRAEGEALYGLGQHQNGEVNLADENLDLTTFNLIITIPYLVSSNNYGILWDNNSDSRFGRPDPATALHENLNLFDASGEAGGLTVRYFDGDELLLERQEKDTNYQFLDNNSVREFPMPEEVAGAQNLRVELEGAISSDIAGTHELLMYSSGYAKLYVDGELALDRWRMNWNPWYHPTKVELASGTKTKIKVDWTPQGGYMRLMHHQPSAETQGQLTTFASDTAKAIDYYFVAGDNKDELISGYRELTGKSVMLPRWAYGFWQSRERYKSQDELIDALKEYRDRKIPIDNIVLDWSYWPVDAWGSHDFDSEFFPDPKSMVKQVHDLNAQIMISVWPKFYPTTENYKELDAKGYMFNRNIEEGNKDWIYPGYLNAFYDAYNPEARDIFWRQLHEKVNVLGFDAWWLDAVEPDIHSNVSWEKRKWMMSPNHLGTGAEVFNAYAVPHAETVYEGDRAADPDKRVFILTRSGFGGIQRTASAIWSGDTVSRWSNLKEQIAAGIGTGMAGVPNWTFDIGGFTPEDRYRWIESGAAGHFSEIPEAELAEWQELNTRWYQFGAFVPLYRSHGQSPYREIYNIAAEGSAEYNSMVWYTKLRYRLMPYIYSQAGDMYHKDATLMRGLAMDFPSDKAAASLDDQYMFGPAFLVNPVYELGAKSREVYLPAGTQWFDFYSGKSYDGGQTIDADAPLDRMPLFVKAGSIVPTGPEIQHTDEIINADVTLNVYVGEDGNFELYEDDGRSYGYEKGEWSRIPITYSEETGQLTIGERVGSFPGMSVQRNLQVRWISGESKAATNFDSGIAETIAYDGSAVSVVRR